jgi:hypothetical protein
MSFDHFMAEDDFKQNASLVRFDITCFFKVFFYLEIY